MSTSNMYRMLPPPKNGGGAVQSKSGAKITVAANSFADLPFDDAFNLNGWIAAGIVGTTAQRPSNAAGGTHYIDTTLSLYLICDGNGNWRNPVTGAIV